MSYVLLVFGTVLSIICRSYSLARRSVPGILQTLLFILACFFDFVSLLVHSTSSLETSSPLLHTLGPCLNHVSSFCKLRALTSTHYSNVQHSVPDNMIMRLSHLALASASLITLPLCKESSSWEPAFHIQTNQSRGYTPNHHPCQTVSHSGSLSTCPNHPGQNSRQEHVPMPQCPLKLFSLASPKPAYPAFPIPSHKTTLNPLADISPLLLSCDRSI